MSVVCIAEKSRLISEEHCYARQRDTQCACVKGIPALVKIGQSSGLSSAQKDELTKLKRRIGLLHSQTIKYAGPALEAFRAQAASDSSTEGVAMPPRPGKPASSPPVAGPAPAPAPSEREDWHEEAVAAEEAENPDEAKSATEPGWPQFEERKNLQRWAETERVAERKSLEAAIGDAGAPPPPSCEFDGCSVPLRANNLSGLCRTHRNKVTSRARGGLVPPVVRAAGTARNAIAAATLRAPSRTCTVDGCDLTLRADNASGMCRGHSGAFGRRKNNPPCSRCGKPLLRNSVAGKHFRCRVQDGEADPNSNRQRAMARAAQPKKAPRMCSVGSCGRPLGKLNQSGKCDRCSHGIHPGSGHRPCASVGCPKRVQIRLGLDRCSLCRRGLKHHLVSEEKMPRKKDVDLPSAVVAGFDISKLSLDELTACTYELHRRLALDDEKIRRAKFALAGEPFQPAPSAERAHRQAKKQEAAA